MEATTLTWYWIITLGFGAGLIGSLLGVGGGFLIVPILVMCFAFPQKVAQGTSLAVIVPMALMGALRYQWNPAIRLDWPLIIALSVTGIVGSNIGASLAAAVSADMLRKMFGALVIIVGLKMIFSH